MLAMPTARFILDHRHRKAVATFLTNAFCSTNLLIMSFIWPFNNCKLFALITLFFFIVKPKHW